MDLKYYKVCRVKCRSCGDVLEYENRSRTDRGPGAPMMCSCKKVGLDPSATMFRILGNGEHFEDLSEEWPAEEPSGHKSLEDRLTSFYDKPIDEIGRIEGDQEYDWGKPGRWMYEAARNISPGIAMRFATEAESEEERFFWAYICNMNLQRAQKKAIENNLF